MVNLKNKLIFLLVFLICSGCSVQSRKDQENLILFFKQKNFTQAHKFLEQSSLKEDKENRLLYLMELGNLYYYQAKYEKAARVFNNANELVDKLYTKSVKEALASSVLNDNSKSFYGAIFERSQLYLMQAMSFYKLANTGYSFKSKKVDGVKKEIKFPLSESEIRKNLDRSRATLVAWNSFFQQLNRMKGIKTFQKNDLIAKIVAASLHEALGSKRDKEIALQLYRDAYSIFVELAPTQKIFNDGFKSYNKELKEYYNKKLKKSQVISLHKTIQFDETKDFLKTKILKLAKKYRANIFQRLKRQLKPSKAILKKLQKKHISFHIEKGMISGLVGRDFSYNLRSAVDGIKDPGTKAIVNGIGVPVLTYFALGPLGLGYATRHGNLTVYSHHGAGTTLAKEVGIEFELPYANPSSFKSIPYLLIKKSDKIIKRLKLSVVSSLSDISFIHAQEMIDNSFTKRATRVGIKYALAIVAAYKTYSTIQQTSGDLFAKPAAVAQFLISQKGIKETEKADSRHWSSLPSEHLMADVELEDGDYEIVYQEEKESKILKSISLGKTKVNSAKQSFFSYRAF